MLVTKCSDIPTFLGKFFRFLPGRFGRMRFALALLLLLLLLNLDEALVNFWILWSVGVVVVGVVGLMGVWRLGLVLRTRGCCESC